MNHVKEIKLFEAKNFKDWNKYLNYLSKKYDDNSGKRNKISIFSESNQITLSIKYQYYLSNIALLKICKDFENLEFKIFPSSSTATGSKTIAIEVYNIPKSYFDQIDIELNAEKYNI